MDESKLDENRIGRKQDWPKKVGRKLVGRKQVGRKLGARLIIHKLYLLYHICQTVQAMYIVQEVEPLFFFNFFFSLFTDKAVLSTCLQTKSSFSTWFEPSRRKAARFYHLEAEPTFMCLEIISM